MIVCGQLLNMHNIKSVDRPDILKWPIIFLSFKNYQYSEKMTLLNCVQRKDHCIKNLLVVILLKFWLCGDAFWVKFEEKFTSDCFGKVYRCDSHLLTLQSKHHCLITTTFHHFLKKNTIISSFELWQIIISIF